MSAMVTKLPEPLGHLDRLAVAQQLDHLHQLDVERDRLALALGKRGTAALIRLTVPAWSAPQMSISSSAPCAFCM
jgi:hypothetical protein